MAAPTLREVSGADRSREERQLRGMYLGLAAGFRTGSGSVADRKAFATWSLLDGSPYRRRMAKLYFY